VRQQTAIALNRDHFTQQFTACHWSVFLGHRVAPRHQAKLAVDIGIAQNAVDGKIAIASAQDDVSEGYAVRGYRLDGEHVAGPKAGQHAVSARGQAHLAGSPQDFQSKIAFVLLAGWVGKLHRRMDG
jgi:hypothetical protein